MKKYYNAKSRREVIILHRYENGKKYEDRIPPSKFAWYFCVERKDVIKHKKVFQELIDDKYIDTLSEDDDPKYIRIYCRNANIWRDNKDQTDNKREILKALKRIKIQTYEADVPSHLRYLIDNNIKVEDNHYIGYYDIETKDVGEVEIGKDPIISIAVVDQEGNEWCFCDRDERKVLSKAIDKLSEFTILCSWYGADFDWDYIKRRCALYDIPFKLWDVNHIDLLAWFKKALQAGAIKDRPESFKLDDIAEQYIGKKKTEGVKPGHGRLWRLFKTNPDKVIEYNINDCILLRDLDMELRATAQIIKQCCITGAFPGYATPSSLTDNYLLRLAKREKKRLVSKKNNVKGEPFKFPGGRVFIKKPGLYDEVMGFDFSGYYNSIMRFYNMGPDTAMDLKALEAVPRDKRPYIPLAISPYTYVNCLFIQQLKKVARRKGFDVRQKIQKIEGFEVVKIPYLIFSDSNEDEITKLINKVWNTVRKHFTIKQDPFHHYFFKFRTNNDAGTITVSPPMPIYFRQDFDSIVTKALTEYTRNRNIWKAKKKEMIARGISEKEMQYQVADIMDLSFKLLGNIVFGQQGNKYARIYRAAIALSITMGAQFTTNLTKKWFEDNGRIVVYMDTDSNYIFDPLYTPEREKELLSRFEEEYHEHLEREVRRCFRVPESRKFFIELEYEKVWKRMLLVTKKRYAGKIRWTAKEGDVDKLEIKGLEPKRRGTLLYTKNLFLEMLDKLLNHKEKPEGIEVYEWLADRQIEFLERMEFNEKTINQFIKRVTITKRPEEYKKPLIQSKIVSRIFGRGDHFDIGTMLQYIFVELNTGKVEGEEVNYFLEHRDEYTVDKEHYWNTEIYAALKRIMQIVYNKQRWLTLDTEVSRKSLKREDQLIRRISSKKGEREKTLNMIAGYSNFDPIQKIELLEKFMEEHAKDFPDSPLIHAAKLHITTIENEFEDFEDDE